MAFRKFIKKNEESIRRHQRRTKIHNGRCVYSSHQSIFYTTMPNIFWSIPLPFYARVYQIVEGICVHQLGT